MRYTATVWIEFVSVHTGDPVQRRMVIKRIGAASVGAFAVDTTAAMQQQYASQARDGAVAITLGPITEHRS